MTRANALGAVVTFLLLIAGVLFIASPGWACITAGVLLLTFALMPHRPVTKETK